MAAAQFRTVHALKQRVRSSEAATTAWPRVYDAHGAGYVVAFNSPGAARRAASALDHGRPARVRFGERPEDVTDDLNRHEGAVHYSRVTMDQAGSVTLPKPLAAQPMDDAPEGRSSPPDHAFVVEEMMYDAFLCLPFEDGLGIALAYGTIEETPAEVVYVAQVVAPVEYLVAAPTTDALE